MSSSVKRFDILSVEDQSDTVVGTLSELDLLGFTIDIATNLVEARSKLEQNDYTVFLLDMRLPEKEGGDEEIGGGMRLISELNNGDLGELNRNKRFCVVTAQAGMLSEQFQKARAQGLEPTTTVFGGNCMMVYTKASDIYPLIEAVRSEIKRRGGAIKI